MALLDLQGMEAAPQTATGGSSGSGHSCPSNLSVTLCGGGSGLSVLICH
ncbi:SapB/AmfS family lanthipeptide [Actinophytocola sp. NPDC049390]